MIHTETINNLRELHQHIAHWDTISPGRMSPTRLSDWVKSCATNFTDDTSLYILTANDQNLPVSIAPFCLKTSPIPHLELLGARQLGEPTDLIYQDSRALEHLIGTLITMKLPVLLQRLPADSLAPKAFKKLCHGFGITIIRDQTGYPYIDLHDCYDHGQPSLSPRLKNDLKRALKKAAGMGEIRYQMDTPATKQEAEESYQTYLQIEAASWKGDTGTALIYDEQRNRFFHDLCQRAAQSGILRTSFMLIDQRPVAAILALVIDNRFWLLKTAYDKQYKRCSPGLLLIKHTLDNAVLHGLTSYEFLGHTEPWTKRWTKTERQTVKLAYYPYNISGAMLFLYDTAKKLLRHFRTNN